MIKHIDTYIHLATKSKPCIIIEVLMTAYSWVILSERPLNYFKSTLNQIHLFPHNLSINDHNKQLHND